MTPQRALADLFAQHAELRELMSLCELMADQLDANQISADELVREVARLRIALDAHNQFEELFLRPILAETDLFGAIRLDQMLADHTREHRLMHERLAGPTTELRRTIEGLRTHLEIEEGHFLSSHVLERRRGRR
jgi:hemerythrin